MSVSGDHPADHPPTPFQCLAAAVTSRRLTGAQAAALLTVLGELAIWDELDTPAASEPYRLGLSDRVLAAYRTELARLAGESR